MTIPSAGGPQETVVLPLSMAPGWMMTVNANKVAPQRRAAIIAYRTEAFGVLFDHFFGKALADPDQLSVGDRAVVGGIVKRVTAKPLGEIRAHVSDLQQKLIGVETMLGRVLDGYDPTQIRTVGWMAMLDIIKGGRRGPEESASLIPEWICKNEALAFEEQP
jgi:hypothetical protein